MPRSGLFVIGGGVRMRPHAGRAAPFELSLGWRCPSVALHRQPTGHASAALMKSVMTFATSKLIPLLAGVLCLPRSTGPSGAAEVDLAKLPPATTRSVDFVKDTQPLLAQNCHRCHGAQRAEADLRWDVKKSALKGSDHGPVIVPGKSAESRMIQLVAGLDPKNVMPKKGERLTAEQVGLLRAWIDQGAQWPDERAARREHPQGGRMGDGQPGDLEPGRNHHEGVNRIARG